MTGADRVAEQFEAEYHRPPEEIAFTPYRVCPLGAHADTQLGRVTGFALDRGIALAYEPTADGSVALRSLQFAGRAEWSLAAVPPVKCGDWADHLRGASRSLGARASLRFGVRGVLTGELPIGGLSSSAAVILTFLSALAEVNRIDLSDDELVRLAKEAENAYVGVACGKLDQSCEVYCRRDHLLYLDCLDDARELIPSARSAPPYAVAIFYSGLSRSLAASGYNMRADECRSAAYALKAYAGMPYAGFAETSLRDVPREVFSAYADRLPPPFRMRAAHWYGEMERVEKGVTAWRRGELAAFGQLVNESGASSIENWQTGCPELSALYYALRETPGVYGGRFSGAGFKGCCMALIDPAQADEICAAVEERYLRAFPAQRGRYAAFVCATADGIRGRTRI